MTGLWRPVRQVGWPEPTHLGRSSCRRHRPKAVNQSQGWPSSTVSPSTRVGCWTLPACRSWLTTAEPACASVFPGADHANRG